MHAVWIIEFSLGGVGGQICVIGAIWQVVWFVGLGFRQKYTRCWSAELHNPGQKYFDLEPLRIPRDLDHHEKKH